MKTEVSEQKHSGELVPEALSIQHGTSVLNLRDVRRGQEFLSRLLVENASS